MVVNLLESIPIKNYDEYFQFGKICNHINGSTKKITDESTKKSLIDKISRRLLELEFEENNSMIFRALKCVVKKILPSL